MQRHDEASSDRDDRADASARPDRRGWPCERARARRGGDIRRRQLLRAARAETIEELLGGFGRGLRRCIAKKPVSSPCTSSTQCQSGRCQADAGVCVALTANGLPCASDGECQSETCDPASKVCVEACAPVASNEQGGCMNYDLASMSGYIFFSIVLVPLYRLRRRGQKKS